MTNLKKPASLRTSSFGQKQAKEHTTAPAMLAIALGISGSSFASESAKDADDKHSNMIEVVEVYGDKDARYKALRSADPRRGVELSETPSTITVLTQSQLQDSGKSDLKKILSAQAGVTLGTGENGNAFGDRYIIRGHEARSDVFVDGVRDPGMTTRESFALEQLEISKGPSSTFAGRGSSGGAVNGITKQPITDESFAIGEAGIGSDDYHRLTLDINEALNEDIAVRANLLHSEENVPDREPAARKRVGALLSGQISVSERLKLVADYYHLKADDVPDLGSYFDSDTRKPKSDVPVYLQKDDFLDSQVDALTIKTHYETETGIKIQNISRYGETENAYVTTGARGTTRDASDPEAPGAKTFVMSTHQGWQEVEYFVSQTNAIWNLSIGELDHRVVGGVEYSNEQVKNGTFEIDTTGATNCVVSGRGGTQDSYCGLDGSGNVVANINTLLGREVSSGNDDSNFDVETVSVYALDTVDLNEDWSLHLGLRYDHFDYDNLVNSRGTLTDYAYSDGFWNGHIGVVRHIGENGNIYFNASTATNINGGESDVGGSCGYGGLCGSPDQVQQSDPEQVQNLELGTKWEFFGGRLLTTAAMFQTTKHDVMESVGDAYSNLGTLNTGKNRVEGVELTATGKITDKFSVQLSASMMDSEVLKSFDSENEGRALSNFADDSLYVLFRYEPTRNLVLGTAYTYKSEMFGGQPDSAAGYDSSIGDYSIVVPSYDVVDAFVQYYPTSNINLRLNISNVGNEEYWTAAYRSGAFLYLGDARNVRASITWDL